MPAGSRKSRRPSVLLVDDCADTRELYRDLLSGAYEVREASSGKGGLAEVAASPPDVVVMDLGLSDMRGEDAIALLRQSRATDKVAVIVLSGYDEPLENRPGWDVYLVKPCSPGALESAIARVVRDREVV